MSRPRRSAEPAPARTTVGVPLLQNTQTSNSQTQNAQTQNAQSSQAQLAARSASANFETAQGTGRGSVVRTGPSGMVLGEGPNGPLTVRFFRENGTRFALAVPQYVAWLITFRSLSLGAHVSLLPSQPMEWQGLAEKIRGAGATVDLLDDAQRLPAAGRPFRPSLVVSDQEAFDDSQPIGPWQSLLLSADLRAGSAVRTLRSVELTLVNSTDPRVIESLRRAYFLNARQVRACQLLAEDEVMVAMPRRVVKLAIRPTPTEYQLLFSGS